MSNTTNSCNAPVNAQNFGNNAAAIAKSKYTMERVLTMRFLC